MYTRLDRLPLSRLRTIISYIKSNNDPSCISKLFNVSEKTATKLWIKYKKPSKNYDYRIGHKDSAYYEGDFLEIPVYKLKELEAEEKMISKKNTTTKLWTWEE